MVKRACKNCRRIVKGNICPVCKTSDLSKSWKGILVIIDPENSQLAKEMEITSPGKYAVKVK